MEFANPPVVEVGVDFFFESAPEDARWNPDDARAFLKLVEDEFPHSEMVHADEIHIKKRSPTGIPLEFEGRVTTVLRVHDEDQIQWIRVGERLLGYSHVRQQLRYPGFDAVRDQSLAKFRQYVEYARPTAVRRVALTYLDIVEIPLDGEQGVRFEDYFRIGVIAPETPFGPLGQFSFQFLFSPVEKSDDHLGLVFGSEPSVNDSKVRFRLHWRVICNKINSLDETRIRDRLDAAHQRVVECFHAAFTPRGLALFDA